MENKQLSNGLRALTVEAELVEVLAVLNGKGATMTVILKRTFNQKTYDSNLQPNGVIRFWRVMGPLTHPNVGSDLSIGGLKQWGII